MHFEEIPKVFKAVETQIIFFFNKSRSEILRIFRKILKLAGTQKEISTEQIN